MTIDIQRMSIKELEAHQLEVKGLLDLRYANSAGRLSAEVLEYVEALKNLGWDETVVEIPVKLRLQLETPAARVNESINAAGIYATCAFDIRGIPRQFQGHVPLAALAWAFSDEQRTKIEALTAAHINLLRKMGQPPGPSNIETEFVLQSLKAHYADREYARATVLDK